MPSRSLRAIPLLTALLALLLTVGPAFASSSYTAGTPGFDISYPACGSTYPSGTASNGQAYSFGIVGVTNGRPFRLNPCFQQEYQSVVGNHLTASLYTNLAYPVGSTASYGQSGPAGNCKPSDKACQAYNYGYNAAQYAATNASQQGVSAGTWWLDVETANSWSSNSPLNVRVVNGAVSYFQSVGVTVGIYSTQAAWNKLMGGANLGLPIWVAGGSSLGSAACSAAKQFNGGPLWLVQYYNASRGYDEDYACQ